MYGAAPGAVARDGDRPVFVDELLKAMRAPGKIEEAFNRTMVGVSRATQGEQIPWFSSSLVEGLFVRDRRADDARSRPYLDRGGEKPSHSAARS